MCVLRLGLLLLLRGRTGKLYNLWLLCTGRHHCHIYKSASMVRDRVTRMYYCIECWLSRENLSPPLVVLPWLPAAPECTYLRAWTFETSKCLFCLHESDLTWPHSPHLYFERMEYLPSPPLWGPWKPSPLLSSIRRSSHESSLRRFIGGQTSKSLIASCCSHSGGIIVPAFPWRTRKPASSWSKRGSSSPIWDVLWSNHFLGGCRVDGHRLVTHTYYPRYIVMRIQDFSW
jgi:hypothetical protein